MIKMETAKEMAARGIVPRNFPTMMESATDTRI
jgi:hypothetical protein